MRLTHLAKSVDLCGLSLINQELKIEVNILIMCHMGGKIIIYDCILLIVS